MNTIQIILLFALFLTFLLGIYALRHQRVGRIFFALQILLGGLFVIFPEATSIIARKIGVGRGTDLILYLFIILFYVTTICLISKIRSLQRQMTDLVRQVALLPQACACGTERKTTKETAVSPEGSPKSQQ